MHLNVTDAALMAGRHKSTISRLVKYEKIAIVGRTGAGHPIIDSSAIQGYYPGADLNRVLQRRSNGAVAATNTKLRAGTRKVEVERLKQENGRINAELNAERSARHQDHKDARDERWRLLTLIEGLLAERFNLETVF